MVWAPYFRTYLPDAPAMQHFVTNPTLNDRMILAISIYKAPLDSRISVALGVTSITKFDSDWWKHSRNPTYHPFLLEGMAQLGADPLPLAWPTLANSPPFCNCSSKGSITSTFTTHLLDKEATRNLGNDVLSLGTLSANAILVVLAIDSLTRVMLFEV